MRVCLHTFWDISQNFIGGTERFLIELCKELQLLGVNAFIVCTGDNVKRCIQGVDVHAVIPHNYKESLYQFGEAKASLLRHLFVEGKSAEQGLTRLARYVEQQVNKFDVDIIHLNSFPSSIFFESNTPIIVTNHENEQETDNIWGKDFFKNLPDIASSAGSSFFSHAYRLVPSYYYAERYKNHFNVDIQAANQGVSLSSFKIERSTNRHGNGSRVKILLPSRLEPEQKGHDLALEACKTLLEDGLDPTLTFTGLRQDNEKAVGKLRAHAIHLGINERLTFRNYSDMADAYMNADVVISPERYCSYGLSISESLAMGRPTVLSDIPTYLEIGTGYRHAYFFASGNSGDLAARIREACECNADDMSIDTVQFRSRFDFRQCARQYVDLYIDAIRRFQSSKRRKIR